MTRAVRGDPAGCAGAVDEPQRRSLIVDGASGPVTALDTRTGALLYSTPVGGFPQAIAVDDQRQRAFVACVDGLGHGSVSTLDIVTGRVLRTMRVGLDPQAVAVDARRGRVFVANAGAVEYVSQQQVRGVSVCLRRRAGQCCTRSLCTAAPWP